VLRFVAFHLAPDRPALYTQALAFKQGRIKRVRISGTYDCRHPQESLLQAARSVLKII
jgi:hypothetical protein